MYYRKGQLAILIVTLLALVLFGSFFLIKRNYEFVIYVGVIIFFVTVIIITNRKVHYPNAVLWGLSLWAVLHMAGGSIHINRIKLYEMMILPLSKNYPVIRYDQLVHVIGFGAATLTLFYILKPLLRPELKTWTAVSVIVFAAGLGAAALNEIIEFVTSCIVPESGVGGYLNSSLDLVADFIGALLALIIIRIGHKAGPAGK